jgi:4-hydroxybenzoate polyprenyltransferase
LSTSQAGALAGVGRWPNALIAAMAVFVGAWWARAEAGHVGVNWADVILAALAAVALAAAAYAWNDAADVDIDRIAHPERLIPRGIVTVEDAQRFAFGAAIVGVLLSALARRELGALAVVTAVAMRVYSPSLKRHGLPGNAAVAVLASLPFLWGAWAADAPRAGAMLVLVGAPLHLAREIAKDLDDASADAGRRRTLPVTIGAAGARVTMAGALLVFLVMLVPLARHAPRLAIAIVPAILLAALAAVISWRGARGAPALYKGAMLCAMAALLVAAA